MKKILLTAITALTTCMAHSQWLNQSLPPIGTDSYLYDIEVVNANVVWGNPQDGTVGATTQYTQNFVRTIDGGNNWSFGNIVGSPASSLIANIWPIDGDTCYVSMYGTTAATGGVFKTTNAGASWTEVGTNMFTSATSFPDFVYFTDAQTGIAMGDPIGSPLKYEIYQTFDAGATWTLVPGANLPALTNSAEYGITNLFSHAGGSVWFGTTYGDVYRSTDGGTTWTKAATGLPPYTVAGGGRQDIADISFSDAMNGLALQVNAIGYLLAQTTDGGLTWNTIAPSGTFYVNDLDAIPGAGTFVSAGSNATFGFGTSFSTDNGLTWTDIDAGASHTALDFFDATTGWSGEFIPSGGPGGAWKFTGLPVSVPCGSAQISPGTTTVNSPQICFFDTLIVTTTGVVAPTDGATHGFSILVSSGDISGNNDPLNSGVIVGGTGIIIGPPPPTVLINDGTIFPPGTYYFTPVVYGNATGTGNVTALTLDPTCTNTGISVMVELRVQGDPTCITAITEQSNDNSFAIKNIYPVPAKDKLNFVLNSNENGSVVVSVKDFLGKEVLAKQFTTVFGENNLMLDLANQSAGVYFLTVTGNESTVVSKFVKE
ncbi:MAG TPA: T9SS type A sorting domain-containing protein [Bacteroidia bacterium]|nr:T9SS type A sorting domain-containing protein [Bacteroidia bacterium]